MATAKPKKKNPPNPRPPDLRRTYKPDHLADEFGEDDNRRVVSGPVPVAAGHQYQTGGSRGAVDLWCDARKPVHRHPSGIVGLVTDPVAYRAGGGRDGDDVAEAQFRQPVENPVSSAPGVADENRVTGLSRALSVAVPPDVVH